MRHIVGAMPLLLPGAGAQGADVAQAVRSGQTPRGDGLLVSSSRGILYGAGGTPGADFAAAARAAAEALRGEINAARARP